MSHSRVFPFGQPLKSVEQTDRSPKKAFVLGVYASAVHARWIGADGKTLVRALAVASEPHIFWRGDDADAIIGEIDIPPDLGRLVTPGAAFNGPSGIALDERILSPLGLTRDDAWLCDLVPHSCVNAAQASAIEKHYAPAMKRHSLPQPSIPHVPRQLADDVRRSQILAELRESQAKLLILLGDQPIKWFLRHYDARWRRLSDFQTYGSRCEATIDGLSVQVLALAHPRQIARLGQSSTRWFDQHQRWMKSVQ